MYISNSKNQSRSLKFVVLDSHARDQEGKVNSDGVSVLLFFYSITSLLEYLCNTYLTDSSEKIVAYQIQFVNCVSTMSEEKRKKIIRRHTSLSQLELANEKKRLKYRGANESVLEKSVRLEKLRLYMRMKVANESALEKSVRLEKLRLNQQMNLANESTLERSVRLEKLRLNQKMNLANESTLERSVRLGKLRLNQNKNLANESTLERSVRLEKLRLNQKMNLANESTLERSMRLEKKKLDVREKRTRETIEKSTRLRVLRLQLQGNGSCQQKSC